LDENRALDPAILSAVERGIDRYIAERRCKVPELVERLFSLRGTFAIHRKTFARDFYKHPLNMLWAPPAVLSHVTGAVLEKAGAKRAGRRLRRVPLGIPTELQRELEWRIHTELLELPYRQGNRESSRDALLEAILAEPEIAERCESYLAEIRSHAHRPELRAALERNLAEYSKTRLGVSDLAGSVISMATGYAAFQKATPGVMSVGSATAAAIAQQLAIANFSLGSTLGSWYYAVFPASASAGLVVATTGAMLATVGVLAALSWIVLDPLLASTGFHRRRLDRFVTALGRELHGQDRGEYRVREHYVARVFDILDLLRSAALALR